MLIMPPMDDRRFDLVDDEAGMNFFRLYDLSHRKGTPPGTLIGPSWASAHIMGEANSDQFMDYWEAQFWTLEGAGLLTYTDLEGWKVTDYDEWNGALDLPVVNVGTGRQMSMNLPSQERITHLRVDQQIPFRTLWNHYPADRRGSRVECEKEFAKINPTPGGLVEMINGVDWLRANDPDWRRGAIPQLRRYLAGRFWLSAGEVPQAQPERTNLVRGGRSDMEPTYQAIERASRSVWGE